MNQASNYLEEGVMISRARREPHLKFISRSIKDIGPPHKAKDRELDSQNGDHQTCLGGHDSDLLVVV